MTIENEIVRLKTENAQLKERIKFLEKLILQITQKQSYQYQPKASPWTPVDYKINLR